MSLASQLINWRRELHQHPELSLQEVATTARIRDWLHSVDVTILPFELKTGLVAEIGQGEEVIALRADIDALPIEENADVPFRSLTPGVMHACGHDIHTSVMLGAAILLKQQEFHLPGRVRILFQPAEENFGGAKTLIRAGALLFTPTLIALCCVLRVKAHMPHVHTKVKMPFCSPASW